MEWRDFGYVISSTGAAAVTFSTDVPLYSDGQRVKLTDDPAGALYGTITDNTAGVLTIDVDGGTGLTDVTMVEAGFNPTGDPSGTLIETDKYIPLITNPVAGNIVYQEADGTLVDAGIANAFPVTGSFSADDNWVIQPAGYTANSTSTGEITVTHGLGHTNYTVSVSVGQRSDGFSSNFSTIGYWNVSNNAFSVTTKESVNGAAADFSAQRWTFILIDLGA
jgi:hypothetical protein